MRQESREITEIRQGESRAKMQRTWFLLDGFHGYEYTLYNSLNIVAQKILSAFTNENRRNARKLSTNKIDKGCLKGPEC